MITVGDGYHLTQRVADAILGGSRRPDLVILNPVLPGCTGMSLLAGFCELGWDTPVILVVPASAEPADPYALPETVSGVFVEPIDLAELASCIELVLDPDLLAAFRTMRSKGRAEGTEPGVG